MFNIRLGRAPLQDSRAKEHGDMLVSALDHMADGILIADANDKVVYWNERYIEQLPYLRGHIQTGQSVRELVELGARQVLPNGSPEDLYKWTKWRMHTRQEGRGQVEFSFPDGRTVVFIDRRLPNGGTVCVLRDYTDVKDAERALLLDREQAEASNLRKSRFLANVSQEIRTATQGVLGMAQLLGKGSLEPDQTREHAEVIQRSSQSLMKMLNDLLEYTRLEEGRIAAEPVRFRPFDLLSEISAAWSPQAAKRDLSLQVRWLGEQSDVFVADTGKVTQMLSSLIQHAISHTEHGQIRLEASCVEDNGKPWLEFCTTDTGSGVRFSRAEDYFEPFAQMRLGESKDTQGQSGLSLSIVRGLAQCMGGNVGVRDIGRHGCSLWLRIPAVSSAPSVAPLQTPLDVPSACGEATDQPRFGITSIRSEFPMLVLVVDDDLVNRQVLTLMLRKLHCTVMEAENGFSALSMLQKEPKPDLVFMDCNMPVMDGLEATHHLRDWEREHKHPPIPVIALTARAFDTDKDACLRAGMNDFLTKPVEMVAIQQVIETHRRPAQTATLSHDSPPVPAMDQMPLPIFDETILLERLEGDHAIASRVVAIFLNDMAGYLKDMVTAAKDLSPTGLSRKAHVMAGAAGNVSACELARLAKQFESWAQQGAWADVMENLGQLQGTCERTRGVLETFVKAHA